MDVTYAQTVHRGNYHESLPDINEQQIVGLQQMTKQRGKVLALIL